MERKPDSPGPAPASSPQRPRGPAAVAAPADAPAQPAPAQLAPVDSPPALADDIAFDPADYKWVPVLRKRRPDGWSPQKQRAFIEALADTGSVTTAARMVGMSVTSCYRLRRLPGAEGFAAAWEAAIAEASNALVDVAFDRALNGVAEPVLDRDGQTIAVRRRYNDRLLMFLLRAHQPDRYRNAHRSLREPDEPMLPAPTPVAEALDALEPPPPSAPHLLMAPEELETELEVAQVMGGVLPHWHRDVPLDTEPLPGPFDAGPGAAAGGPAERRSGPHFP